MSIDKFLDCYYEQVCDKNLNREVVVPKKMVIEGSLDNEGWKGWQPAEANISNEEIRQFESEHNIKFPKQYIDYIRNRQFMNIEIENITLYGINELYKVEDLVLLLPENIISFGFFPIGSIDDADFIVLNTHTGEIVRLYYEDYSYKEVLFKDFNTFTEFLLSKINC